MLIMKIILFLWPFLKEMFLGGKTLKESIKVHKGRLFIIGVICISIALNVFTIPKIFMLSRDIVDMNKKYKTEDTHIVTPPVKKPDAVLLDNNTVEEDDRPSEGERYLRMKEEFDRIKQREALEK